VSVIETGSSGEVFEACGKCGVRLGARGTSVKR
jgi:hypothetical protein